MRELADRASNCKSRRKESRLHNLVKAQPCTFAEARLVLGNSRLGEMLVYGCWKNSSPEIALSFYNRERHGRHVHGLCRCPERGDAFGPRLRIAEKSVICHHILLIVGRAIETEIG